MEQFHGTTIMSARRDGKVALGGDGQITLGQVVVKASARKVRRLYHDRILAGFAGGTADAFTLFERFEAKLEKHQGNLLRSAVELAKDWRTDRILRRLEAMLAVADRESSLIIRDGRRDRAGAGIDRDRLGRPLRAVGRARAPRKYPARRGDRRSQSPLDRRRPVHLHQSAGRRRDAGLERQRSRASYNPSTPRSRLPPPCPP